MHSHVIADAAAGPFVAACGVLAFAGASKLRRPAGLRPAARALGLPASFGAIRALGASEMLVGGAGLAFGGVAAAVVAVVYAALAIAAWRLLARAPGTSCGCLGVSEVPVSAAHVVIDVAAVLAAVAATAARSPLRAVGGGAWAWFAFAIGAGCCAWLGALMLDAVPALDRAARVREGGAQ